MNNNLVADKLAITLSSLCVVHCFFTPLLLLAIPGLTAIGLGSESFHLWMVVAVIPVSLFALYAGCRRHKNYNLLVTGIVGLLTLVLALFSEAFAFGEYGEQGLTVVGSALLIFAHYQNYIGCKALK